MTIEIIEEVMPGTSIVEEIVNLQLSVIEGDTAAAEAAAAAAAASAASASSSASTATTQAGIATTKAEEADASATAAETARTGAETAETNAETAQAAAEAARDEITDKIDFTGIQVGDLLQAVDVSGVVKLVRVEPVELLKLKSVHEKSPNLNYQSDGLFAWDNVVRPDTGAFGGAGNLDSGQAWENLSGQNGRILNQVVTLATNTVANHVLAFERIDFSSTGSLVCDFIWRGTNNNSGRFFIGKDANNGICFRIGYFTNQIISKVAGVETVISSNSLNVVISQAIDQRLIRCRVLLVRSGVSSRNYLCLLIDDINHKLEATDTQIGSLMNFFTSASDVKYIGLNIIDVNGVGVGISNLKCMSI